MCVCVYVCMCVCVYVCMSACGCEIFEKDVDNLIVFIAAEYLSYFYTNW